MERPRELTTDRVALRAINGSRRRCCHHWILETPNGATSAGVCRSCGRSRSFHNAFEDIRDLQRRARLQSLMLSRPPLRVAS